MVQVYFSASNVHSFHQILKKSTIHKTRIITVLGVTQNKSKSYHA